MTVSVRQKTFSCRLIYVILINVAFITCSALFSLAFAIGSLSSPPDTEHINVGAFAIIKIDGTYQPGCSGVLLAPRLFLTAGHCVTQLIERELTAGNLEGVVVSFHYDLAEQGYWIPVTEWIKHPDADKPPNAVIDTAVLVLAEPYTAVDPVALPYLGQFDQLWGKKGPKGQPFLDVGYGAPNGEIEDIGIRRSGTAGSKRIDETTITILTDEDSAVCIGDSGAPIFYVDENDNQHLCATVLTGPRGCVAQAVGQRIDLYTVLMFLQDVIGAY